MSARKEGGRPIWLPSIEQRGAARARIEALHAERTSAEGEVREVPEPDLLLLDPSFLFSEEGIAWLREGHGREGEIIVSASLDHWLRSGGATEEVFPLVSPYDHGGIEERRAGLFQLLRASPVFDSERVDLPREDEEVLLALREPGGLAAEVLADEWAFLQSHSWALSKIHYPLDKFRDAGAAVLEYGRRLREEMVDVVIPGKAAPPAVTRALLAKAAAKWLIVGGAGAGGALLGPIGASIVGSGVAVPVVRAFDP